MNAIIAESLRGGENGLAEVMFGILNTLLDPTTLEGSLDKSSFLDLYYAAYAEVLSTALQGQVPLQLTQPASCIYTKVGAIPLYRMNQTSQ